jgi:Mor family transcriptional regulator
MPRGPRARNATIAKRNKRIKDDWDNNIAVTTIAKQNKITPARVYQIVRNPNSDVIKTG